MKATETDLNWKSLCFHHFVDASRLNPAAANYNMSTLTAGYTHWDYWSYQYHCSTFTTNPFYPSSCLLPDSERLAAVAMFNQNHMTDYRGDHDTLPCARTNSCFTATALDQSLNSSDYDFAASRAAVKSEMNGNTPLASIAYSPLPIPGKS